MEKKQWLLFFILTGVCLFIFWNPLSHLVGYHEQHHLFLFSRSYLNEHLLTAETRLHYITDFFIQFFYNRSIGIFLFSLLLASLYLFNTLCSFRITGKSDPLQIPLFIPLFLIVHYTSVHFPVSHAVGLFFCSLTFLPVLFLRGKSRYIFFLFVLLLQGLFIGWLYPLVTLGTVFLSCLSALFFSRYVKRKKGSLIAGILFLSVYTVGTSYLFIRSFKAPERIIIMADACMQKGEWEEVLNWTGRYRKKNEIIHYFQNLALYNRGEMAHDLFRYPQACGSSALFLLWTEMERCQYGHYVYEQLGHLNEAHRWAFESMVVYGETAPNLLRLIRYNIVNNRPQVALKFIQILKQSLFYRKQAVAYEQKVSTGAIPGLRAIPFSEDAENRFINHRDPLDELLYICDNDPTNRMAFEYLMSYFLLSNRLTDFVANINRIKTVEYAGMPPLYEEALYLYSQKTGEDVFEELGFTVSPETPRRYALFNSLLESKDHQHLKEEFMGSYWYYRSVSSL